MAEVKLSRLRVTATNLGFKWITRDSSRKLLPLVALALIFSLSLCLGRYPLGIDQVAAALVSKILPAEHNWSDALNVVLFQVRLPRVLAAMVAGAALSASGAAYQGMFKNPMASPDILDVSAGAGLGPNHGFSGNSLGNT